MMVSARGYMYLSIDVGGTKVLVATFDDAGKILESKKFKTPIMYPDFVDELKVVIRDVVGDQQPKACALALPATLDREQGVALSFGNLPWENVWVRNDLQDTVHCPIYLENDAKMAGLAEALEVKDLYPRVLYITVSTGIGIGLTVNGQIDHSVSDAGGRGVTLEHQGRIMSWEEFGSGKALFNRTGRLASELDDDSPEWYGIARNLAIGLINLINAYSPDCIVIGGGVGSHLPKFHEKLHEELELYRSKMVTKLPQLLQAKHPEEAVIYGGYLLCKQYET
jgi:glucokinase